MKIKELIEYLKKWHADPEWEFPYEQVREVLDEYVAMMRTLHAMRIQLAWHDGRYDVNCGGEVNVADISEADAKLIASALMREYAAFKTWEPK